MPPARRGPWLIVKPALGGGDFFLGSVPLAATPEEAMEIWDKAQTLEHRKGGRAILAIRQSKSRRTTEEE